jgi:hypothetical protein
MQVSNLSAALVDARIETVFGSMKALVKSNSPVFLDFVVGNNRWHSVGRSGNFDPGDYCRGVAATCEVSAFLIDRRIKARSQEKQSALFLIHKGALRATRGKSEDYKQTAISTPS